MIFSRGKKRLGFHLTCKFHFTGDSDQQAGLIKINEFTDDGDQEASFEMTKGAPPKNSEWRDLEEKLFSRVKEVLISIRVNV